MLSSEKTREQLMAELELAHRRIADVETKTVERKLKEFALFEAGALQRAIFNSVNFSSIATDANGIIQIFNVGAEQMLGYSAAEVINILTPADISDPQELIFRAQALSTELDTPISPGFEALVFKASRGIQDIYELTKIRKDGSRFPAIVSVTALRDDQDAIIGYLLIGTDNSARKQAEEELRKSQTLHRTLINTIPDLIWLKDPQGRYLGCNPTFEHFFGAKETDIVGKTDFDFVDKKMANDFRERDIKAIEANGPCINEEHLTFAEDGYQGIFEKIRVSMRDDAGNLLGVLGIARDITLRQRDTELREQIERIIQHDLRVPAGNAIQIARMIRDEMSVSDEQKHLLGLFENAGQNMLDTLDMSLDLYKIETGQYQNYLKSFDILPMVAEMIEIMSNKVQFNKVHLKLLVDGLPPMPDSRCLCLGESKMLRIALQNLLVNALEASSPDAEVNMELFSDKDCRIEIRNHGVVPKGIRGRFFDKFVTKGKPKGTGIGTYSAKMMIEVQGGSITMRTSDEANETVVTVRMPIADQTMKVDVPGAVAPGLAILFVEDDPVSQIYLTHLLEEDGHRVRVAPDGAMALSVLFQERFDLVFMDMEMPVMGGIEATKRIRASGASNASIPIIALTASAMAGDKEKFLAAGVDDYITKPVEAGALKATIQRVMSNEMPQ